MRNPITIHLDIQSGAPVFTGTRVPIKCRFDYLRGGEPLEEFLHQIPSLTHEHAIEVLNFFEKNLTSISDEKIAA